MTSRSMNENTLINLIKPKHDNVILNNENFPQTNSFLNKKTKRDKKNNSKKIQPFYGNQCNICLEYDKYTLNKCIICLVCNAKCHPDCYKRLYSNEPLDSLPAFTCHRCKETQLNNTDNDFHKEKCFACSEFEGILMVDSLNSKYIHWHCSSMIKEIVEIKGKEREIKKWRTREVCRICKEKSGENTLVIKCLNSKCKGYYHIPCAIRKGLLFALYFQYDFYGITREEKYSKVLPFYCGKHNRNLVKNYYEFTNQIDELIQNEDEHQDSNTFNEHNVIEVMAKEIEPISQFIEEELPQKCKQTLNENTKENIKEKGIEEDKVIVPVVIEESPLKEKESKGNEDINKRKTSICDDNPPKGSNSNSNNKTNNNLQYVDPTFYNEFFFNSEIL